MPEDSSFPLEYVHIEPRDSSTGPSPAVFILHGRGADEQDLLSVARQLPASLAIYSLRAPNRLQAGYTWYDLDLSSGGLHQSQPDPDDYRTSLDRLDYFITQAARTHDLDAEQLGLLGFSQGAIMSFGFILEQPARIAWCAGLHGYLPESHADITPPNIAGKPVFIGAGSTDQIIPADRVKAAADRFQTLDCEVSFTVYDGGHGIAQAELTDLVAWVEDQQSQ